MFVAFMVTRFVNVWEDPSLRSELQKQPWARDGNSLLERERRVMSEAPEVATAHDETKVSVAEANVPCGESTPAR